MPTKPKLAFMHIMKTAGTTLRYMLASQYERDQIMPVPLGGGTADDAIYPTRKVDYPLVMAEMMNNPHWSDGHRLIMGHYHWGHMRLLSDDWNIVSFFRDPVERYLSHYYFIRNRANDHQHYEQVANTPLADFLDTETSVRWLANNQARTMAYHYDAPITKSVVNQALIHLGRLATIGIVEQMPESIALLESSYGFKFPMKMHLNQTPRTESISGDLRQRIMELNGADYVLYEVAQKRFREQYDEASDFR